ncbi:hypothetical protein [Acuticoccus kandeliae]|uniref:hypothetical protein n=1 Tax=Acuticoccus kandeliae TaxID=2073160 RepID=UPI000D3E40CC|nr:hypothetical protein [Acuticoccus kandeliae]
MNSMLIVLVILAGIVFGLGLTFALLRQAKARRAAFDALGAARGWRITETQSTGGSARTIDVAPEADTWSCRVTRFRSSDTNTQVETTELRDPATALPAGAVLIGPPIPAEAAAFSAMLLTSLDSPLGQKLLAGILGDAAGLASGLVHVAKPGGAERAFTVLASGGAEAGVDFDRIEAAIAPSRDGKADPKRFPIVLLGEDGLRVRMRASAYDAETLATFIDTALALRAAIREGMRAKT